MEDSKNINGFPHIRYSRDSYDQQEMLEKSRDYYRWIDQRRTVRDISDRPVPKAVVDQLLMTASTAPSGAHKQPWTFCAVSIHPLRPKSV